MIKCVYSRVKSKNRGDLFHNFSYSLPWETVDVRVVATEVFNPIYGAIKNNQNLSLVSFSFFSIHSGIPRFLLLALTGGRGCVVQGV